MSVTAIRSNVTIGERTNIVKSEYDDIERTSTILALDNSESSALASLLADVAVHGWPGTYPPHPNELEAISRIRQAAFGIGLSS